VAEERNGPSYPLNGRWHSADTVATTDWEDYDLDSELERLGADPMVVALYVVLARAIRTGHMSDDLVKRTKSARRSTGR
jgi:hypothetical protein